MSYRKDINGLRGLAVLAVLFFHLNLGILPGGFVGVDIFFVISGYLISKIIYTEILNDRFSLVNFYERRAKRILPALFSIIFICSLLAYSQFYPSELVFYAKSALASALFSANIYFYSALGYFSPAADQIPLLHLWSLGIEEQFYIVFPFLLMFIGRKSPKILTISLVTLTILSLLLSQWMLYLSPSAAFYLLPFRAFELLIGSCLALCPLPRLKGKYLMSSLSMIGFASLFIAIFMFTPTTRFPGLSALLPCVGTALIIWSGEYELSLINKLISMNPWRWVGTISYSLYLVHWPIIVFSKRFYPHYETFSYLCLVLILFFIFAYLNYTYVEQPFRHLKNSLKPEKILAHSMVLILSVVFAATFTIHKKGFPSHIHKRLNKILAYLQYDYKPAFRNGTCFQDHDLDPKDVDISSCLPKGPRSKTILLWGDSHSAHLYAGLKKTLESKGFSLGMLSSSACPPIVGFDFAPRPYCKKFNKIALPIILKVKPKIVILSADWATDDPTMDLFEKTIQQLKKEQIEVVILGKSPLFKKVVPLLIAEQLQNGKPIKASQDDLLLDLITRAEQAMIKRFSNRDDLRYISVMDNLCPYYDCPIVTKNETPVYYDISHLTVAGSELFAEKLTPLILKPQAQA